MSDLPPGWTWTTLGEVAETVRGVTYKKSEAESEPGDRRVPLLRATNIVDGVLALTSELVYVPISRVSDSQFLSVGDIVIAASSGSRAVVGKSAPLRHYWSGTFGAFCSVARPRSSFDGAYIAYLLGSETVRRRWSHLATGTNINNLKRAHFTETPVPLPPLNEQRRIVAAIEEHLSRLDDAAESLRQAGFRLDQLRTMALSEPFDVQWPSQLLADVNDPERPIRYGILMPKEHVDDGVLYVRVKDYPNGQIEIDGLKRTSHEIAEKYRRATLQTGDVLLAIRGTYGRVAIVPPELEGGNITQDTARIAPLPQLDARFVAGYLRSAEAQRYFQRVARGVAVKGVNIGDLRTMPIPVPPLEEQRRIVAEVEERLGAIDALRAAIERAQRRGAALRRSVLERAFRGQLVPQDPSDEPASVLLDRIRAERAKAGPATGRRRKAVRP